MLLEQQRTRTVALSREVARFQAGIARQNARIAELEQREAAHAREMAEVRVLVSALTAQNTLLQQQVAALQQENALLGGAASTGTGAGTGGEASDAAAGAEGPQAPRSRAQCGAARGSARESLSRLVRSGRVRAAGRRSRTAGFIAGCK